MPQVAAPVFFCVSEGFSPVSFALLVFPWALCSQQTVWTWMCCPPFIFCVFVPSVINLFSSRRANGGVSGTVSDIVGWVPVNSSPEYLGVEGWWASQVFGNQSTVPERQAMPKQADLLHPCISISVSFWNLLQSLPCKLPIWNMCNVYELSSSC